MSEEAQTGAVVRFARKRRNSEQGRTMKREKPTIEIDKDAIRFNFKDSNSNFSFEDLFTGNSQPDWQTKVMRAIKKAYDECVRSSKTDNEEDNEDE